MATPSPPPHPSALPPWLYDHDYVTEGAGLTLIESDALGRADCRLGRLKRANKTHVSIVRKLAGVNPHHTAIVSMAHHFPPSADTAFMTSPPQMALARPAPTAGYNDITRLPRKRHDEGRPLLLILDLNGTLLHRVDRSKSASFSRRKYLAEFLAFSFSVAKVMIWTTAQPKNAALMRNNMLTPAQSQNLVATWGRDRFNLNSAQYHEKTQVYKRLEWVWADDAIQRTHPKYAEGERWNQLNTILLDDSEVKAAAQPYNHILVPEFEGPSSDSKVKNGAVLEQVAGYIEEARHWDNVSAFMRDCPFEVDDKVGGHGAWFKEFWPNDELDPTGQLWPRTDVGNLNNFFMNGYDDENMQWG